jgi:hypothetical protein
MNCEQIIRHAIECLLPEISATFRLRYSSGDASLAERKGENDVATSEIWEVIAVVTK